MTFRDISFVRASIVTGLLTLSAAAQSYMPPTSMPPAADYEPQGEYVGTVQGTGAKLGAWLVSRGSSRFDVTLLPGGLLDLTKAAKGTDDPNGGWDGKTRYAATNITLSGTTFTASINGGGTAYQLTSITGTGANRVLNGTAGGNAFTLTRKTGEIGSGGDRQSPTLGLRPEGKILVRGREQGLPGRGECGFGEVEDPRQRRAVEIRELPVPGRPDHRQPRHHVPPYRGAIGLHAHFHGTEPGKQRHLHAGHA
jgi:hypothetical protein